VQSYHNNTDETQTPTSRFEMSYIQAITHRVEAMEMNLNPTNPDTHYLRPKLVMLVRVAQGWKQDRHHVNTMPQCHSFDPSSTATLVIPSSISLQVCVSPAPASGWKCHNWRWHHLGKRCTDYQYQEPK